jgi:hypothetical protein
MCLRKSFVKTDNFYALGKRKKKNLVQTLILALNFGILHMSHAKLVLEIA